MSLSSEMRRLDNKWRTGQSWPKRLEWLEITGIRGWQGQRVDFQFPIVAIVGENGSGKSTALQAAASIYQSQDDDRFASEFFPDTPFERVHGAIIRFSYREGNQSQTKTVRKPSDRWRGNPERPKRELRYVDLSRIQPVGARVGYVKLLKSNVAEGDHTAFDEQKLARFSEIMGRQYAAAGLSLTNADQRRAVPVLQNAAARYSGFHQGTGEIAAAELLAVEFPKYGLILIDEIETSLHPRAQRRLIRDLARIAREQELQIVVTTHSPYILDELPPEGRIYIMNGVDGKSVVTGVSPEFAMTRMDEEQHPEADVYVEDNRASALVAEALVKVDGTLRSRTKISAFGSASVGNALGQMVAGNRFPRPSVVFLDGDQARAPGCYVLPGGDAPEIVLFNALRQMNWRDVAQHIGRGPADTIDALNESMAAQDHHQWPRIAADRLFVGSDQLWQAICVAWVAHCATPEQLEAIATPIRDALP